MGRYRPYGGLEERSLMEFKTNGVSEIECGRSGEFLKTKWRFDADVRMECNRDNFLEGTGISGKTISNKTLYTGKQLVENPCRTLTAILNIAQPNWWFRCTVEY